MEKHRDSLFRVEVETATPQPQRTVYKALHQDYCENPIFKENIPGEYESGLIAARRLLQGKKHHYGPLEHPSITFSVAYFPHSVMQQARTHRVGVSFDVQSMRYTGKRICEYVKKWGNSIDSTASLYDPVFSELQELFYVRPVGSYTDRQGNKYDFTEQNRKSELIGHFFNACEYVIQIEKGYSEEHARGSLHFDFRQHFVVSFTLRAFWHFLCVRGNADAQMEIRILCDMMLEAVERQQWAPELFAWFKDNLYTKKIMAP